METLRTIAFFLFACSFCQVLCQDTCKKGQVDFLFLVDSSNNVGINNYNLELRTAANLAENFQIGPDAIQFGAVTFAVNSSNIFDFNTHEEYIGIEKALLNAPYLSGISNTFHALETGRNFFTSSHGARTTAEKVALVFTNGRSSNTTRTQEVAAQLKSSGVYVVVIALPNSNTQELLAIASEPQAVLNINNFNDILHALNNIVNNTCTKVPCIKGQLDLLYLIDSSSNVGANNFNREVNVASNLAENFHIGPDAVQFGAITFADTLNNLFDFDSYVDFADIQKALVHAHYQSGISNTSYALEEGRNFFTGDHGARNTATRVALVFTDGRSANFVQTQQQAALLKQLGVYVIAVGFPNSNGPELQAIASEPQSVLQISDFNGILHTIQNILNTTCNNGGHPQTPCVKGELDVAYLLDSSSSVGAANFELGLGLAANLAENFHIGVGNVLFASILYGSYISGSFNFTANLNYTSLKKAILTLNYTGGSANTSLAIEQAKNKLFSLSGGDRVEAPNVVIVISNGMSSNPAETIKQAQLLKNSGVYVIAVGYSGANKQELESIASQPNLVFDIYDFNALLKALQDYNNNACNQVTPN